MSYMSKFETDEFEKWLVNRWKIDDTETVRKALDDKLAFCFLIAWSILEPICLDDSVPPGGFTGRIESIASKISQDERSKRLQPSAKHFYDRYQNPDKFRRLMHCKTQKKAYEKDVGLKEIITTDSFSSLSVNQYAYLLLWVIFRYRNNIYHGNKTAETWLNYRDEIQKCIFCMQLFVDVLEV